MAARIDTTYKVDSPPDVSPPAPDVSPANHAPEKLFPNNPEPASSKEVIHDAPEVVEPWLAKQQQQRPSSPFSEDETVVSGFQPLGLDEKGEPIASRRESEPPPERPPVCGIPRKYLIGVILLVFVLLVALGLGIGLGLGLQEKNQQAASQDGPGFIEPYCVDHPEYCIGGALGTSYYTTNGTMNGTGIALATEFWNNEERKVMTVYFQHWTGEIRYIQLTAQGEWIGGTRSEVIATDAKNATPISTVSYTINSTTLWHIFYISPTNHLRQKHNSNRTNIWQDGPLNALNLSVHPAPNVGLQACWYGNYYGDSDATKFPTRDGNNNTIPFDARTPGMHLWYPPDAHSFRQWGWYEGQDQWAEQHAWGGMNAHAGVGCFSWGPGSVTYAMMVDGQNNEAGIWWKDSNGNLSATEAHPVNSWEKVGGFAVPRVHPSTSLGFTEYLYAQMRDGTIRGFDVEWGAENTTGVEGGSFTVGSARGAVPGLKGTHMSVTVVEDRSGGRSLYVFYQTRGDDLSVFTRDFEGGQFTQDELPIPDT